MSIHSMNGPNGSFHPTSPMPMEEVASAAPLPPPVVQRVNALSQSMKRPLDQSEATEGTVSKRPLSVSTDHCLAVQNLLALSKQYARENRFPAAVEALLQAQEAARRVDDPFGEANFLEKLDRDWVQSLLTHDLRIARLLLQKDWVRMAFEQALHGLSARSTQDKPPTCFVCFAIEAETNQWLEKTFVPDLDQAGIAPLFCLRHLKRGGDINRFQYLIRLADSAVIICTPELKKRCEVRAAKPTGCAMEVYLATGRENIYPVCLKGNYPDLAPNRSLDPRLAVAFTNLGNSTVSQLYSYYAGAIELFGSIRGFGREEGRNAAEAFLKEVQKILKEEKLDETVVRKWHEEAPKRNLAIDKIADPVVKAALKHLEVVKDHSNNLTTTHPHFVCRFEQLKQLSTDFALDKWQPLNQTLVRVLLGPGGIGKTELAIKFGNLHFQSFSVIWFLRAETRELFEEDYRALAEALKVEIDKNDLFKDVQRKVHKALEKEAGQLLLPWLLIFDNVAARIEIPERGGYVIATSQTKNDVWENLNDFVEVAPFSPQDTKVLFRQMNVSLEEGDAELLVEQMEGFPVLLEKVGQCLKRTPSYTLEKYLREIKSADLIWQSKDGERYPKKLGQVFQATLEQLARQNGKAHAFIQFCAYLNPDRISTLLLDFWIKNKGLTENDRIEIETSFTDFMLLRYDRLSQTFSCHRLLQLVIQRNDKTGEIYRSSFDTLAKWTAQSEKDYKEDQKKCEECFHHVEQLRMFPWWGQNLEKKERIELLINSGNGIIKVRLVDKKGEEQLEEALELSKAEFGENSNKVAEINFCIWAARSIRMAQLRFWLNEAKFLNANREYDKALGYLTNALDSVVAEDQARALRAEIMSRMGQTLELLSKHRDALLGYLAAFSTSVLANLSAQHEYFRSFCQSLEKQTDIADAVNITEQLLAFCIQHCGEASDHVLQLRKLKEKLASARTNTCWLM